MGHGELRTSVIFLKPGVENRSKRVRIASCALCPNSTANEDWMSNLLIQLQFFSDFDGGPQFPEIFKIHENATFFKCS